MNWTKLIARKEKELQDEEERYLKYRGKVLRMMWKRLYKYVKDTEAGNTLEISPHRLILECRTFLSETPYPYDLSMMSARKIEKEFTESVKQSEIAQYAYFNFRKARCVLYIKIP